MIFAFFVENHLLGNTKLSFLVLWFKSYRPCKHMTLYFSFGGRGWGAGGGGFFINKKCVQSTQMPSHWRSIEIICCNFFIIEYIYLIFIHRGQNISTFKNIYNSHVYRVAFFSSDIPRTSRSFFAYVHFGQIKSTFPRKHHENIPI